MKNKTEYRVLSPEEATDEHIRWNTTHLLITKAAELMQEAVVPMENADDVTNLCKAVTAHLALITRMTKLAEAAARVRQSARNETA